jgi:hypothetical protein
VDSNLSSNWWVSQLQKSEFAVLVPGFEKLGLGLDNCGWTTKNVYCRMYSLWVPVVPQICRLDFFSSSTEANYTRETSVNMKKLSYWTYWALSSVQKSTYLYALATIDYVENIPAATPILPSASHNLSYYKHREGAVIWIAPSKLGLIHPGVIYFPYDFLKTYLRWREFFFEKLNSHQTLLNIS